MTLKIYAYNPITKFRVLPDTVISDGLLSKQIHLTTTPGEYIPATFVLRSDVELTNVVPVASDLSDGLGHSIPSLNVDLKIVKCWYQRGDCIYPGYTNSCRGYGNGPPYYPICTGGDPHAKCMVPELLLNDDALVYVDTVNQKNYLWRLDKAGGPGYEDVTIYEDPGTSGSGVNWDVQDATTLQPVTFGGAGKENKQYWATIHVPNVTTDGTYTGTITINVNGTPVDTVTIAITVLPFPLPEPVVDYGIFYGGFYDHSGYHPYKLSCTNKATLGQLAADYTNMFKHGIHKACNQPRSSVYMPHNLDTAQATGYDMSTVITNIDYCTMTDAEIDAAVTTFRDAVIPYGVTKIYVFDGPHDEQDQSDHQQQADRVRSHSNTDCYIGVHAFCGPARALTNINILDWVSLCPSTTYNESELQNVITQYHNAGKLVGSYSNPQSGEEKPALYRQNYGLYLWQRDYDWCMEFAYQKNWGNPWNDWECSSSYNSYKQHIFSYPTTTGSIDTTEWEGFREGCNDVKYLTKLIQAINEAPSGDEKIAAQAFVTSLKTADLRTADLDQVRQSIIDHILSLLEEPPCPPDVDDCASFTVNVTSSNPAGDFYELPAITWVDTDTAQIDYQIENTGTQGTLWTGLYIAPDSDPLNPVQGLKWEGPVTPGAPQSITLTVTVTESVIYYIIIGHKT